MKAEQSVPQASGGSLSLLCPTGHSRLRHHQAWCEAKWRLQLWLELGCLGLQSKDSLGPA